MAMKESRGDAYRQIMERAGYSYDECRVLAFRFEKDSGPEIFHYGLMNEKPVYYLFDFMDDGIAQVIVPNDEQNAAKVIAIAEKEGGRKVTPNLR